MKKASSSSINVNLIVGLILLALGLLLILRVSAVVSALSTIISLDVSDLLGIVMVIAGEAGIVFGAISVVTIKVQASAQEDRMLIANTIARASDQQTAIASALRVMQEQGTQANAKLQQILNVINSIQPQGAQTAPLVVCRFCGAQMGNARFCPNCGKAQV